METLIALRNEFPRAKIIVMSGGGAKMRVDYLSVARELAGARTFIKPVELHTLSATVRELASCG